MRDGRIKYYVPADYSEDAELDSLVKLIIDRTAANEKLESFYYNNKKECIEIDKKSSEEERYKIDLLIALENSRNFATTHSVIEKLKKVNSWSIDEKETFCGIAIIIARFSIY